MGNGSYTWESYALKKICITTDMRRLAFKRKHKTIAFFSFALLMLFVSTTQSFGQTKTGTSRKTTETIKPTLQFKDRWAFRTNAVDWILLLPNITAEFDLFNTPYKHYTLSLGVRGNWNSTQNYAPDIVYNMFDIRSEFRRYHRTDLRNYKRPDSLKISIFKRMKEDVFTWKRFHPRTWRAYYWGIYADACNYSLKFGKEGHQGTSYGLGVSGGFGIPLYAYKKNFLDLEFGASVGMVYTQYDVFKRDGESNCYPVIPSKHKDFHLLPYPVISELRVAFVYRFASIKGKYSKIDESKREARLEKKRLRAIANDSINAMREKVKLEREARKDSLNKIREAEKLQKTALKDSLELVKKQERLIEKAKNDSIRAAIKLQKAELKNAKNDSLKNDSLKNSPMIEISPMDSIKSDSKITVDPLETDTTISNQSDTITLQETVPDDQSTKQKEESETTETDSLTQQPLIPAVFAWLPIIGARKNKKERSQR